MEMSTGSADSGLNPSVSNTASGVSIASSGHDKLIDTAEGQLINHEFPVSIVEESPTNGATHGVPPVKISQQTGRRVIPTKRAEQNRIAQKAFRARRGQYVKQLEEQVRNYSDLDKALSAVRAENKSLREALISQRQENERLKEHLLILESTVITTFGEEGAKICESCSQKTRE